MLVFALCGAQQARAASEGPSATRAPTASPEACAMLRAYVDKDADVRQRRLYDQACPAESKAKPQPAPKIGDGEPKKAAPAPRRLFVSKDTIANFGELGYDQNILLPIENPLGATLGASSDSVKHTQSISNAQAYIGYCLVCGELLSADTSQSVSFANNTTWGFGPAVELDGSLTEPLPAKSRPLSALRLGPDFSFAGVAPYFFLDAMPYYQSDFRGDARMTGLQLLALPFALPAPFHEFKYPVAPQSGGGSLLSFSSNVIPEADLLDVATPGQTAYKKGSYDWTGVNANATLTFFPGMTSVPIHDRLSATFSYQYLTDADDSRIVVKNFQAELDYKLPPAAGSSNGAAGDPNSGTGAAKAGAPPPTDYGIPAISLVYIAGSDELTLQFQKQLKLQLSYKY
jgi:hypothetical protein